MRHQHLDQKNEVHRRGNKSCWKWYCKKTCIFYIICKRRTSTTVTRRSTSKEPLYLSFKINGHCLHHFFKWSQCQSPHLYRWHQSPHTDPKALRVVMDPLLTFKNHAMRGEGQQAEQCPQGADRQLLGMDKEILLTTHNAINKSVFSCAPVWTPALSTTKWNDLQKSQNATLRTALGCTKMTDVDHLHSEARLMPVRAHNEMLSKQFLLQTCRPNHPNKVGPLRG